MAAHFCMSCPACKGGCPLCGHRCAGLDERMAGYFVTQVANTNTTATTAIAYPTWVTTDFMPAMGQGTSTVVLIPARCAGCDHTREAHGVMAFGRPKSSYPCLLGTEDHGYCPCLDFRVEADTPDMDLQSSWSRDELLTEIRRSLMETHPDRWERMIRCLERKLPADFAIELK